MDLARAFSEVKSLPDEALQREMSSPTGMIPPILILGEMGERQQMRLGTGGSFQKKPTIAQQIMQGQQPQAAPEPGIPSFATGGAVLYKQAEKEYARLNAQLNGHLMPPRGLQQMTPPPTAKSLLELIAQKPYAPLPSSVAGLSRLLMG